MTPDPHPYAVAAQMIAANVEQLSGLYVSVVPSGIEIQGHPELPVEQQIRALRRLADRLDAAIVVASAQNHTFRAHTFDTTYDGIRVRGFVHERTDIGRTDEIRIDSPISFLGAA